jgi:protein SCO1/2
MKIKPLNLIILLAAAGIFAFAFFKHDPEKPIVKLPIFGEKVYEAKAGKTDTSYHTIPDFSFINQDGKTITQKDVANSVYVTDFFFTTCHTICPIMSDQMERVYESYKGNEEVKFLSHTVDPEIDTVEQLKSYALRHNADSRQWMFLTGAKKDLYEIARKGYLMNAEEGDGGPDDFIHTQLFALIDKHRRIRGYYDGTDSLEMNKLITDIGLLLKEEHYEHK